MNIAIVVEAMAGGTGRHVADLASGLARRSHSVTIIYSPVRAEQALLNTIESIPGITTLKVPFRRQIGLHDASHLRWIGTLMASLDPFDVIHGHSSKAGAMIRLLPGFPRLARVYSPHAIRTMDPTLSAPGRIFYGMVERILSLRPSKYVAGSQDEVDALSDLGIPAGDITLLDFAVERKCEVGRVAAREMLGLPADAPVIGFVGRLSWQKAPERAIRALASMKRRDTILAMIGDGATEELEELTRSLGVANRVRLLGFRDGPASMAAFDCLFVPSRYDSSPYVLLEALAAGLPIVATPLGMAAQIVGEGSVGRLVANGDQAGNMAMALDDLLEPATLAGARAAARKLSETRSFDAMIDQMERVYRSAIEAATRSRTDLKTGADTATGSEELMPTAPLRQRE